MQRTTDYFTALAALIAIALLYQTAADRWLHPPEVQSVPMAKKASLRPRDSLADLFPSDAWQRGTCQQLQLRDAVLLFDELKQGDGDLWTFSPVTVVYRVTSAVVPPCNQRVGCSIQVPGVGQVPLRP